MPATGHRPVRFHPDRTMNRNRPVHASPPEAPVMPVSEGIVRRARVEHTESKLERCIEMATAALLERQRRDGHWVFELEADATISAEYVILQHYLGDCDPTLEAKIASYLRRLQAAHGGWPLFNGGPFNISASVKAYFALK